MSETKIKAGNTDRPAQTAKEFAQQGTEYSKNLVEKSEAVADETSKSIQKSYAAAVTEAANFNAQWIEMVRVNTNASLDFVRQALAVRSPSEFLELSATHSRQQLETFAQQVQQLAGLAQKSTAEAMKPLQASVKSVFDKAA